MRIPKALFVVLVGVLSLALGATAGSLTPSALPAATMHSLANIYDSIASAAFDSSAIVANQNGSLLGNLKYIENQIVWASGSGNIWNLNAGNVGIGTTTPTTTLDVIGAASISTNFEVRTGYASLSNTLWVSPPGYAGNVGIGVTSPNTGFVLNRRSLEIQSSHDTISSPTSWANIGTDEGLFLSYDSANHNGRIISIQSGSQLRDLFLGGASISFSTGTGGGITERMRISGAGNVGIGVGFSSIEALLEVGGTASISGLTNIYNSVSAYGASETITGPTSVATAGAGGVQILYDRTNNKGVLRSILSGVTMEPLYFQANEFRWATGAGSLLEKMVLTLAGNIGIGSIAPEQKLEVAGNILASASGDVSLILRSTSATGTDGQFTILTASTSDRLDFRGGAGAPANTFMSIASSGNVGIGDMTPEAKFEVVGLASVSRLDVGGEINASYLLNASTLTGNGITMSVPIGAVALDIQRPGQGSIWSINANNATSMTAGTSATTPLTVAGGSGQSAPLLMLTGGNGAIGEFLRVKTFAGQGLFVVDVNGNVGIGSTTPEQKLEVAGNIIASASGNVSLLLRSTSATGTDGQFTILTASTSDRLDFRRGVGTLAETLMSIASSGNVGIGTTTPAVPFQIGPSDARNMQFYPAYAKIEFKEWNQANLYSFSLNDSGDGVRIGGGYVQIDSVTRVSGGSATANSFGLSGGTSGMYSPGASTVGFSTSGIERARIDSAGHFGIGTNAPGALAHIASTGAGNDGTTLLRLQDENSTCNLTAQGTGPACGSDLRLKKDIVSIEGGILDKLIALDVVNYRWKTDDASASLQTGFIAQNVQAYFPSLVATASWIDGQPALFLSQDGLIPYIVKGIQELASKDLLVDEMLASAPVTTPDGSLARLVQNILAYIAEAFGFVVEKGKIQSDKLCAGTTCIDEQQLKRILQETNSQPTTDNQQPPIATPLLDIPLEPTVASGSVATSTPTPSPTEDPPLVIEASPSAPPAL